MADEFDFDGEPSPCSSSLRSSSRASSSLGSSRTRSSVPTKAFGRTRNQRLRAKGLSPVPRRSEKEETEESSQETVASSSVASSRRVRFSVQDEALQSSQPSSSSSSPRASKPRIRSRRPKKPPTRTLRETDEDNDEEEDEFRSVAQARGRKALFPQAVVKGAKRMNVFSLEDSGNYQRLLDECNFCCAAILSAKSAALSLEPAQELTCLLANRKNRQILFMESNKNDFHEEASSPIHTILQVVATLPRRFMGCDERTAAQSDAASLSSRTKQGRMRQQQQQQQEEDAQGAGSSKPDCNPADMHKQQQVLHALALTLYFLSHDVTLSSESASPSAATARRIRKEILKHGEGMQGIMYLILSDPLLYQLQGRPTTSSVQAAVSPLPSIPTMMAHNNGSGTSSEVNSCSSPGASIALAGTPDSSQTSVSSSGSVDPTRAGRRRRKRRRLEFQQQQQQLDSIPEDGHSKPPPTAAAAATKSGALAKNGKTEHSPLSFTSAESSLRNRATGTDDNSSMTSNDSFAVRLAQNFEKAQYRALSEMAKDAPTHCCGQDALLEGSTTSLLALVALNRIISGKNENDEVSCIDDADDTKPSGNHEEEEDEDDDNPLLLTNKLLGESGVIPLMAQGMADALAAVRTQLHNTSRQGQGGTDKVVCDGCLCYLNQRVSALASLVDGTCLLNDSNRKQFCQEGFSTEAGGCLVVSLVMTLMRLLETEQRFEEGVFGEIGLETLRTLTSLTHENEIAAKELELPLSVMEQESDRVRGLDVLARLLKVAVDFDGPSSTDKLRYDSIIFCLNTFANVVESGGSRSLLAKIKTSGAKEDELFLSWLARWLVSETNSFQDAIVQSTFGSSPSKHASRRLDKQEDEKLVTAGNGFVLLACLMIDGGSGSGDTSSEQIRESILSQVPGDDHHDSLTFIKNTLKAFCNFYHFSVGDLSVAIVAPVKELMLKLEAIQEDMRPSCRLTDLTPQRQLSR